MKKLNKILSVVLTFVMLFTTLCFFALPEANAVSGTIDGVTDKTYASADNVIIAVPETIYMTPSTGKSTSGQYYVNNTIGSDGKITLDTVNNATKGKVTVYAPGAKSYSYTVAIGADAEGETIGAPSVTDSSLSKAITNGLGSNEIELSIAEGLAAGKMASVKWTFSVTFENGSSKTFYAYSTLYSPWYQTVGAAAEAWSGQGISSAQQAWLGSIAWVEGVHGSASSKYYPGADALLPMIDKYKSSGFNNQRPTNQWLTTSAGITGLVASFTYTESDGSNHRRANAVSPEANMTVDTSRYNNFNQIPNFKVGYMITDSENTDSGKYYFADYTGYTANMSNDGTGNSDKDKVGNNIYNMTTGTKIATASDKGCAVKYYGVWNRAIATGTVQLVGAAGADETGGTVKRSAWNYLFVKINVTGVDKAELRKLVLQATSICQSNYVENGTWAILIQDMQNAAYVLGNPCASSADVEDAIKRLNASVKGCEAGAHPGDGSWAPAGLQVTVNFNGNGADSISTNSAVTYNVEMNPSFAIPNVTVTKKGYTFKGWKTNSGTVYASGEAVNVADTVEGVIDLVAQWEVNKYTFTFDNLIDFRKWNTSTASNATISDVANGGFKLTSNAGVGEGTSTSPLFPVEAGKTYTVSADFVGDNWDVYIFFYEPGVTSGLGKGFTDSGNRFSSSQKVTSRDFTAPEGVVNAVIRLDANDSSNTVEFRNIRVYEAGTVREGVSYVEAFDVNYGATLGTLTTPTKLGYEFSGWKDASGTTYTKDTVVSVEKNTVLYSQWNALKYTVSFVYDDGVTGTKTVEYTIDDAITLPTPTKTGHVFMGWKVEQPAGNWLREENAFTGSSIPAGRYGSVTLKAQWDKTKHTITWENYDGTVLETDTNVLYGSTPKYDGATPTRPSDGSYDYTFKGWTPVVTNVTGDATYKAEFTSTKKTYTITWKNVDGSVFTTYENVDYGTEITPPGVNPADYQDAEWDYTFDKWIGFTEGKTVDGNMEFTASFTKTHRTFTVIWYDEDGKTVLEKDENVEYGTTPTFDKGTPTKERTDEFTYEFKGWTPAVTAVTKDTSYKAQYNEIKNYYTVKFSFYTELGAEECTVVEKSVVYGTSFAELVAELKKDNGFTEYLFDYGTHSQFTGWTNYESPTISKNAEFVAEYSAAVNHTALDVYCTADCNVAGFEFRQCTACGYFEQIETPAFNHKDKDGNSTLVLKEGSSTPTCTQGALLQYVCTIDGCNDIITEYADALGHNFTVYEYTPATCTTAGNKPYKYCERCALYFDANATDDQEAGALTDNLMYVLSATGHFFSEITPASVATCDKNGNHAYKSCSACKEYFAANDNNIYSENGTVLDDFIIETTGHTPTAEVYENESAGLSCTVRGSYDVVIYCAVCGDDYSRVTKTDATLPHNERAIVIEGLTDQLVSAANCKYPAVYKKVCSMCCNELSDETFTYGDINENAHVPASTSVNVTVVEPTCYSEGTYVQVIYCKVCSEEYIRISDPSFTIPTVEHTPGTEVTENPVAATCTSTGSYDKVTYCSVCAAAGRVYETSRETVTVDKLAHTPDEAVIEKEVAPTCYAEGSYDEVIYCAVCGTFMSRTTVSVEKVEHTSGNPVTENVKNATCYAQGSYDVAVYCSVCEAQGIKKELSRQTFYTDRIPHTAGEAVKENEVAADCQTHGSYDSVIYCTVCAEKGIVEILSSVHHDLGLGSHVPGAPVRENEVDPTDVADGSYDEVIYCTVAGCGHEISRVNKPVRVERTITFLLKDGSVVIKAYNGDVVEAPEVEEYIAADGFVHVFKNWNTPVTAVNGNAIYVAIYTEPCNYSELDRLEITLNAILEGIYNVDSGVLQENWAEINAVLSAIEKINADRNYRDVDDQTSVDLVVDRLENVINTVCPDAGSSLVIIGSGNYKAGTILDLKVYKLPAETEVTDVIWTSSDPDIVFVVGSTLYAVAPGTVTITASKGNLKTESTIEITMGGAARVIMFDSLIYGANYVVQGSRIIESTTNIFWSPSAPIQFRVIATGTLKEYVVYVNDVLVTPDETGTYTIAANTGDAHVRIEGRVTDITNDDESTAEKVSIWELIRRFFQKIGDFFRNLFN